jgi:chromosome partitioning protein
MKKPTVIIFSNWKGGVGKSTLNRELGVWFSTEGFKVLLVDIDPQGNLTKGLTKDTLALGASGAEIAKEQGLHDALNDETVHFKELGENLNLLSGDIRLAGLEKHLMGEMDAYSRLKELLEGEEFKGYDLIFLDTPPSLGVLTINALSASDYLIIPMNPSVYSMQGTNDLLDTVAKVRKSLNPELSILGVIINCYDGRPIIHQEVKREIEENFKDKVFQVLLSKSVKIEEAIALKEGVVKIASMKGSKTDKEIRALGGELLLRLEADYGRKE